MNGKSNDSLNLAKNYLKQSKSDFGEAKTALRRGKLEKSSLLFSQAANNALASIPISRGRFQNPVFNLAELLGICLIHDPGLEVLREVCDAMDSLQEKSLFVMHKRRNEMLDENQVEAYRDGASRIIAACEASVERNGFFSRGGKPAEKKG